MTIKQRKTWIDLLRGFCMLAILLDHTEIYYTGGNIINYNLYVPNALTIFFVLSGYLMYREGAAFSIGRKLTSIVRGLLLPYFIFTTIIAVPKSLVHEGMFDVHRISADIVLGQASWFVAALIVAETVLSCVLWTARGRTWAVCAAGIVGGALSVCMPPETQPYFWQIDNAMQAVFFLSAGYLLHKYEARLAPLFKPSSAAAVFLLLALIKVWELAQGEHLMVWPIRISNYYLFLSDTLLCAWLMVAVCRRLPPCPWVEYVGRHCLVCYFFCGGVPLVVSRVCEKAGFSYSGHYLRVLAVWAVVCVLTASIACMVYRYFPWSVGKGCKRAHAADK